MLLVQGINLLTSAAHNRIMHICEIHICLNWKFILKWYGSFPMHIEKYCTYLLCKWVASTLFVPILTYFDIIIDASCFHLFLPIWPNLPILNYFLNIFYLFKLFFSYFCVSYVLFPFWTIFTYYTYLTYLFNIFHLFCLFLHIFTYLSHFTFLKIPFNLFLPICTNFTYFKIYIYTYFYPFLPSV